LQELAKRARELRAQIKQEIAALDQHSDASIQTSAVAVQLSKAKVLFPFAAAQLSSPAFNTELSFPFVGSTVPKRFKEGSKGEDKWFYSGREDFVDLVDKFQKLRNNRNSNTLWVYGTKGYGKSHLLAALACYLTAQGERVVYVPDCRELLEYNPVANFLAAILFAWADDDTARNQIITLDSQESILHFFENYYQQKAIFILDQMNGFAEEAEDGPQACIEKEKIHAWLARCRGWCKAIYSCSANYRSLLYKTQRQNTIMEMNLQGGFTKVSHDENNRYYKGGLPNCDSDGNGAVVGAE
jgi:hypothetical protein